MPLVWPRSEPQERQPLTGCSVEKVGILFIQYSYLTVAFVSVTRLVALFCGCGGLYHAVDRNIPFLSNQ